MTTHPTREAWLLAAVELLRPLFKAKKSMSFLTIAKSHADLPAQAASITSGSAGHAKVVCMIAIKFSSPLPC
jgi:hypothetical protein